MIACYPAAMASKSKDKCPGEARPIEYAVPAFRQVRNPRTGELVSASPRASASTRR